MVGRKGVVWGRSETGDRESWEEGVGSMDGDVWKRGFGGRVWWGEGGRQGGVRVGRKGWGEWTDPGGREGGEEGVGGCRETGGRERGKEGMVGDGGKG
jgi:hypothetical protein